MTLGKATPDVTAAATGCTRPDRGRVSVLYDDQDEQADVEFVDEDLIGAPLAWRWGTTG